MIEDCSDCGYHWLSLWIGLTAFVQICHGFDCDASDIAIVCVLRSWARRSSLIVLGPCLALGRSAAEKGSSYLTQEKIMTEETPFWNTITEAGSGIKAPSCCIGGVFFEAL